MGQDNISRPIKPSEPKKCLHGKTQSQNESFNSTIWERAPKINYC